MRLFLAALLAAIGLPVLAADVGTQAILLVAKEDMPDPFFRDSVVLVTNAASAPVGIIINKPLDMKVAKAFPKSTKLASRDDKVYFGGPVDVDSVVYVFRAKKESDDAMKLFEDIYISGSREILDKLLARDNPLEGVRVFVGHAGWSPGQLEAEISRGDWDLAPANASTLFTSKPENLWTDLHRRASATKIRYNLRLTP